jgi:type II secretory pathway component PulK
MRSAGIASDPRGFALLAVMLVLALLGVVVTELAFSMRLETAMVRTYRDAILARYLAEAGIQQGIREVLSDATVRGLDDDGQVVFYKVAQTGAKPQPLPTLPRSHVPLGSGEFSYRITDEEARVNVNNVATGQLVALLLALGVEKQDRSRGSRRNCTTATTINPGWSTSSPFAAGACSSTSTSRPG